MNPRMVLFDAGGTLVHPNWERVAAILREEGVEADSARLQAAEPVVGRRLDTPEHFTSTNDRARWGMMLREIFREAGVLDVCDAILGRLQREHDRHNLWERVPRGVPEALERMNGRRKAVVSNANGTVRALLGRLGLAGHFEHIFDSHEVGFEKPDPRIFHVALERLGVAAADAVYVGDIYHIDVLGARAAGLDVFLLDPHGLHADRDCRRVRDLGELATILG